jgi:hypothetical protein
VEDNLPAFLGRALARPILSQSQNRRALSKDSSLLRGKKKKKPYELNSKSPRIILATSLGCVLHSDKPIHGLRGSDKLFSPPALIRTTNQGCPDI